MKGFGYDQLASRVVSASAPARTALVGEIDRLGGEPVLVIASARDPQLIGELVAPLGVWVAGSFTEVREHVPVATADAARAAASRRGRAGRDRRRGGQGIAAETSASAAVCAVNAVH